MRPNLEKDHGQIAWDYTLKQHSADQDMELLYKSFHAPNNTIEATLKDLLDKTSLANSTGAQLDNIGSIVGVSRAVPRAVFLPFFGYSQQPSGRAYGKARYRNIGEGSSNAYLLPDDEYRAFIRAKIVINNSHGTTEDLIEFSKAIFRAEVVRVETIPFRQVLIMVQKALNPNDPIIKYYMSFVPVAAGVKASFSFMEGNA
jgi:hypothetical protein